jgi:hypothetical protein
MEIQGIARKSMSMSLSFLSNKPKDMSPQTQTPPANDGDDLPF